VRTVASRVRKWIAILAILIAPLAIHLAMATQRGIYWAGILVVTEAALIAWIALSFVVVPGVRLVGCAIVLTLTTAVWRFSRDGIVASSAIPHAIAYLSVLAIFGASLAPGRKAIVTVFAEKSRGALPPAVMLYTRRVTWAWCLFCVAQLLGSGLLLLFAPVSVWSAFVNGCNLPLLAAMFCGEFAWRKWRHGSCPWERLTDGFRMAGQVRATTTRDGVQARARS
jgi:uncharacterized membrane protein